MMEQQTNPPEEEGPKQVLDESTGEMVSKNELKKRIKQRKQAADKLEKEKLKKQKEEEKKKSQEESKEAAGSDDDLDVKEPIEEPNKYTENRKHWLQTLRDKGENPYPHKYSRTHKLDEFYEQFIALCPEESKNTYLDALVRVTGRVNSIRSAGKKLVFYDIVGDDKKLQVQASKADWQGTGFG